MAMGRHGDCTGEAFNDTTMTPVIAVRAMSGNSDHTSQSLAIATSVPRSRKVQRIKKDFTLTSQTLPIKKNPRLQRKYYAFPVVKYLRKVEY